MHTFWRRWLAGQRCRCWREGAPWQIPVGRCSLGVETFFFCCFRWWRWSCDCQPSPRSCGPCVFQAAIAAACRRGPGAIQCLKLLWGRQTQLRPSFLPKSYPRCPVSTGWPGLRSTSRVESPPAPEEAMGRWLGRHERMSLSRISKGHTAQIWAGSSLGPPNRAWRNISKHRKVKSLLSTKVGRILFFH